MPSFSSQRKRQTRLAFNPLPSSSPALSPYHEQIRNRAAAVCYDGSPSPAKRRKIVQDAPQPKTSGNGGAERGGQGSIMPTPEPSNQPATQDSRNEHVLSESSDSEPVRPSQGRSTIRKAARQHEPAHQTFTTVHSPLSSSANTMFGSLIPTPRSHGGVFSSQRTARKRKNRPAKSSSEDEEVLPSSPSRPRSKRRKDDTRATRSNTSNKSRPQAPVAPKRANEQIVDFGVQEDSGSDSDLPLTPAMKRKKVAGNVSSPIVVDSDHDSAQSDDMSDSEDELPRSSAPRRLRRGHAKQPIDARTMDIDSSAGDDDGIPKSSNRNNRQLSRSEQAELDDDVLDLQTSDIELEPSSREKRRDGRSAQKIARQEALEKYKKRRLGQRAISVDSKSPSYSDRNEETDIEEDEDENDDMAPQLPLVANEEDEDFIVEDDDGDGTLGIPEGLPIEYSHMASWKAKDLFPIAIDWMVRKKINPAFKRDDPHYDLAFRKLNDEVQGLAGSSFSSAAWTPDFTYTLRARPEIVVTGIDRTAAEHFMRDKCDACNRSGHPATYAIQFQGQPYDRNTLEETAGNAESESESESGSDSESNDENSKLLPRDTKGRVIAPESRIYYVGRFCMANAETGHALEHWKHELYAWVVGWLTGEGHNTPEKIVQRDNWTERKRSKYADKVIGEMETTGEIKKLYKEFKSSREAARNSKQGRWD